MATASDITAFKMAASSDVTSSDITGFKLVTVSHIIHLPRQPSWGPLGSHVGMFQSAILGPPARLFRGAAWSAILRSAIAC